MYVIILTYITNPTAGCSRTSVVFSLLTIDVHQVDAGTVGTDAFAA